MTEWLICVLMCITYIRKKEIYKYTQLNKISGDKLLTDYVLVSRVFKDELLNVNVNAV